MTNILILLIQLKIVNVKIFLIKDFMANFL